MRCARAIFTVCLGLIQAVFSLGTVEATLPESLVWHSPSEDSFGSMPLGNGDIGANVWVEPSGDVVFYISKVDAFDAGHLLPKLGRVRLKLDPALPVDTFRQSLVLRDGAIEIQGGAVSLRIWIDAHNPVIRVEGKTDRPRRVVFAAESLRPLQGAAEPLAAQGTVGVLFADNADRLAWCYRNQSSAWAENLKNQNTPEMVASARDPILGRTSGCLLRADGFLRQSATALASSKAVTTFDASIRVLSNQPQDVQAWLTEAEMPVKSDWTAHRDYWREFWNRSYIHIDRCSDGLINLDQYRFTQFPQGSKAHEGHKQIPSQQNADQITRRYALERFCQAAAGRGRVPPPYNGSIFTMDMPAGVLGFDRTKPHPVSPDGRDWAVLSFMWQNTRHPYWSMAARGDYDTLLPGLRFVRDGLEICRDRCRKLFNFDGAFIMEASWWYNVGVFNWDRVPQHLRYHLLASIEMPLIMTEYYEHTRDRQFLDEILLPCADEFIAFYANRFPKRDASGKMLMEGVGCAETFQGVTNPCTEMGCLKLLLGRLLTYDLNDLRRQRWSDLLAAMPGVPTRRICGLDLLAVGDVYEPGRTDCETPELYSIYPFRQTWLGTPDQLALARQSFHVRNASLDGTIDWQPVETGGWQAAPVQAAYLGLAREAARLTSINFNDRFIHWAGNIAIGPNGELMRGASDSPAFVVGDPKSGLPFPYRPRPRFEAFWECKMDGTPDNDHGANSVAALQSMLLLSDGPKIYLLPAWPEDWDVSFKLRANENTAIECVYRNGKVQSLNVSPESRRGDITDMSTLKNRIRTLVSVACADRNYLFGLPPMLDGVPTPGPVTGPWLAKYGQSLEGVKAGPWPGCVFRGNTVYVHLLNGPVEKPSIPARLISSTYLTEENATSHAILKLEYDRPIEPIALAAVSAGSLTAGKELTNGRIDLGNPKLLRRLELVIDNPGYLRGQAVGFELLVMNEDGSWKTAFKGNIYGCLFSFPLEPVTAQFVRLKVNAPVKRLDLF